MILTKYSNNINYVHDKIKDNINVIYQFFINSNNIRDKEIKFCLKKNVENIFINKIYLLNEKIYSEEELGVNSSKIIQINIGKRLKFMDVFNYINNNNIIGYNVIINADIFFDNTIDNLCTSDIHLKKKMFALLRFEYNVNDINKSELFGPRANSQDTWIIHSNFNILKEWEKVFDFNFGQPGCDNKIIYLMEILGYDVINHPHFIKSYHYHSNNIRNYDTSNIIMHPYGDIVPYGTNIQLNEKTSFYDNKILYEYIKNKFNNNQNFIIPNIIGDEANYAIYYKLLNEKSINSKNKILLSDYINNNLSDMKNICNINFINTNSIKNYSKLYIKAINNCEIYAGLDKNNSNYQFIATSQNFIENNYKDKKIIWTFAFNIFNYIYSQPWTIALNNKKILIISEFDEIIKNRLEYRDKIYGIELFPNCQFITLKSPKCTNIDFYTELTNFTKKIDNIKDSFDIALIDSNGFSNIICNHIYKNGKSAIYIGQVLKMYFGIYNDDNKLDNDIIKLFANNYWINYNIK